jgi:Flp pilus assembly pilin Flp
MLKRLWADEGGAILSAELILIMTILVIGLIAGLKTLQDAVVTELADVAGAIGSLNQSYGFYGTSTHLGALGGGAFLPVATAETAGSYFADNLDSGDQASAGTDSQGIDVSVLVPPSVENAPSTTAPGVLW